MFFKKKKKLQPHIHFEQPEFKRRLKLARGFRRVARPFDDSSQSQFRQSLRRVKWTWVLPFFVAAGISFYVVFIPNFLFLREVTVRGVDEALANKVKQEVLDYARNNRIKLISQSNVLFLQADSLREFLLAADLSVAEVKSIQKKYPHSLVIDIEPRLESYTLESPRGNFLISNDGVVIRQFADGTPEGRVRLVATGLPHVTVGQRILTPKLVHSLDSISNSLPKNLQISVSSIELVPIFKIAVPNADGTRPAPTVTDLASREIVVYTTKGVTGQLGGFKIWFSVNDDIAAAVARLQLLLSEQSQERLKKLAYVDMRLNKRSFLCLVDAPCAQVVTPVLNLPPVVTPK